MPSEAIQIHTVDGVCPARVFQPAGDGRWPGVIMFMDGLVLCGLCGLLDGRSLSFSVVCRLSALRSRAHVKMI